MSTKLNPINRIFEPEIKAFIESLRPKDLEIRKKLDYGYSFESQKLILLELRPGWKQVGDSYEYDYEAEKLENPFAKAWFIKSKSHWQIYWMRANGNWYEYEPNPVVKNLSDFFEIVKQDKYGCFFG